MGASVPNSEENKNIQVQEGQVLHSDSIPNKVPQDILKQTIKVKTKEF